MICPKCGNELKEGNMYCEVCGEEIQIVPDFEPEIENSISDVLSNVADEIDPERLKRKKASSAEKKDHKANEDDGEDWDDIRIEQDVIVIPKKIFIKVIGFFAAVVVLALVFVGVNIYQDNSYGYHINLGDKSYSKGMYSDAIAEYERAYELDQDNSEALFRLVDCYTAMGNIDKEIEIYDIIVTSFDDENAFEQLIKLYIDDTNFSALYELLSNCDDSQLKEKYSGYISLPPEFSFEGGEYDKSIEVELKSADEGKIYYTLDESEPGSDSILYEGPIFLRNGNYTIKAVFLNSMGIFSDVVERQFEIVTDAPENPIVSLADGTYTVPQMINVSVINNANIYYTTDGTIPGSNSAIYTNPIAIPMGESVFKFVAISENGNSSEIIERHYSLNVETKITQEQALEIVQNRQFELGRVISPDGSVAGGGGKYLYSFTDMRYVQNRTLYFISEYYQEGTIRMSTGNLFAVDVYDGSIYQAVEGSNNNYSLHNF